MNEAPALWSKQFCVQLSKDLKLKRENWDYLVELWEADAAEKRVKFDALKKKGFTDEQCIQLIK